MAAIFAFAGNVVETHGALPFSAHPPSEDWLRELHSFGWLRHLRAAGEVLAGHLRRRGLHAVLAVLRHG